MKLVDEIPIYFKEEAEGYSQNIGLEIKR